MSTKSIVIGITDCSKYQNYEAWFASLPGVSTIKISYHDTSLERLNSCHGIVLSGGEDVHPRHYNKMEYLPFCHEIDERRDELELKVLEHVKKNDLPLLGICRGLQIANVFFGGTLVPDIPAFGKFNHSRFDHADRYHLVEVDVHSTLYDIVGSSAGEINSAHHQAAEMIGSGMAVNSISKDGVVEGIERISNAPGAFLQLVQWHPERMANLQSSFSQNIRSAFLKAVGAHIN